MSNQRVQKIRGSGVPSVSREDHGAREQKVAESSLAISQILILGSMGR